METREMHHSGGQAEITSTTHDVSCATTRGEEGSQVIRNHSDYGRI